MEHVLTSDDVCNGKPAPDIFIAAARRLGADASACIVFEDSPHGVTAGALCNQLTAIAIAMFI